MQNILTKKKNYLTLRKWKSDNSIKKSILKIKYKLIIAKSEQKVKLGGNMKDFIISVIANVIGLSIFLFIISFFTKNRNKK